MDTLWKKMSLRCTCLCTPSSPGCYRTFSKTDGKRVEKYFSLLEFIICFRACMLISFSKALQSLPRKDAHDSAWSETSVLSKVLTSYKKLCCFIAELRYRASLKLLIISNQIINTLQHLYTTTRLSGDPLNIKSSRYI